jgi:hypothetical protein
MFHDLRAPLAERRIPDMMNEFRLALCRKEVHITIAVGVLLALLGMLTTRNMDVRTDIEHLPSAYQASLIYGFNGLRLLYVVLIPFISIQGYADSFMQEKRSGVYAYCLIRQTKRRYFLKKAVLTFMLAFFLTAFPLMLNQAFCLLVLSPEQHTNAQMLQPYDYRFFLEEERFIAYPVFAAREPLAANAAYMLLAGLYGSALSLAAYALSLFFGKSRAFVLMIALLSALALEFAGSLAFYEISPLNALCVYAPIQIRSAAPLVVLVGAVIVASAVVVFVRARSARDEIS